MASRAWTMRALERGDFDKFRVLYGTLHGFVRPAEYDEWLFNRNPYGFPTGMVAVAGERLAGLYMLTPAPLIVGGRRVQGAQSVDTMTHPDYRNQGIFVSLARATIDRAADAGHQVLYGLPNENSFPGFIRRLEWAHTGDIRRWLRILNPSKIGRIPSFMRSSLDYVASALPPLAWPRYDLATRPLTDGELAPFFAGLSADRTVSAVVRDMDWVRWRYDPATGMNYEWVSAWHKGQCVGAALWGMRTSAWAEGQTDRAKLVEIVGTSVAGATAAVGYAARRAAQKGALFIETLSTSSFIDQVMHRAWFLRYGKPPLIVKRLVTADSLPLDVYNHSVWRIRGGDSDTY